MSKGHTNKELRTELRSYELTDFTSMGEESWSENMEKSSVAVKFTYDQPAALLKPRKLRSLNSIPKTLWDENGRCYLIKYQNQKQSLLKSVGVKFDEVGAFIERGDKGVFLDALQRYLPSIAHTPMFRELIPATSWGSNLHNLLSKNDWQKLRSETFANASYRCEVCGNSSNLECHELWKYYEPILRYQGDIKIGVQELLELMALCPQCHEAHHLGFANTTGKLEKTLKHIAIVNNWGANEIDDYCEYISIAWKRRSQFLWMLDLSFLKQDVIIVQKKWRLDDDNFIHAKTARGLSLTRLLGIEWRHEGDTTRYITKLNVKVFPGVANYIE